MVKWLHNLKKIEMFFKIQYMLKHKEMSAFATPALLKALEKTFGIKCNVNEAMPLSVVLRQAATLAKDAEKEDAKAKKLRESEDKKTFGYGTKSRAKLLEQLAEFNYSPTKTNGATLKQLKGWLRSIKESAKSTKSKKKPKPKKSKSNKAMVVRKGRDLNAERSAERVRQIENLTRRWTGGRY